MKFRRLVIRLFTVAAVALFIVFVFNPYPNVAYLLYSQNCKFMRAYSFHNHNYTVWTFKCRVIRQAYKLPTTSMENRLSTHDVKQSLAELFLGAGLPTPDNANYKVMHAEYLSCIQSGTVIFVETPALKTFLKYVLPLINVPIVLVSGDSDEPGDISLAGETGLMDGKLLAWFAMNCQYPRPHNATIHPFHCIPIGLCQWGMHRLWLDQYLHKSPTDYNHSVTNSSSSKIHLLLFSFAVESYPEEREQLWRDGCEPGGKYYKWTFCYFERKKQEDYYELVRQSKFVASPRGNGMDCYRTWEALYLGSFVVVKSSSLDTLYKDLPVLIVGKWEDLSEQLLEETFERFTRMKFRWDQLELGYWRQMLYSYRTRSNETFIYQAIDQI